MEIFYHDKTNIAAARIESNKKRRFNLFGPKRISIVKKKIEFEKDLAVPKVIRFGEFRNRIPQDNRVNNINMFNVNERQAIPKISLSKLIAKPVVENQSLMQKPKSSFLAKKKSKNSENERYPVPVRKVKDDLKAAADAKKMLKLLFK